MNKYNEVRDKIKVEYETTESTLLALSKKYNVPYDTVSTWKIKFNWKNKPVIRTDKNKEDRLKAQALFCNTSYNLAEISSQLNISRNTLQDWKTKYNWIKNPKFLADYKKSLKAKNEKIYLEEDNVQRIKNLYETTALSIPKISEIVGLTKDQVWNRIKKFNFKRPDYLVKQSNVLRGQAIQSNLTETQKLNRNIKIKKWNIDNVGKIHHTRKQNNRYSKSQIEDKLYEYLIKEFGKENVERQYIENNFSFDFKINRVDISNKHRGNFIQLVELNGGFYHNFRPYIECEEHIREYEKLYNRGGMYRGIAHKWRDIDTEKFKYCKQQNLNYTCIYFDITPKPYFTEQELIKCFNKIKNENSKYTNISRNNEIVDNFCYKELYKNVFNYFKTEKIYSYLVNRIKYANDYGYGCHVISELKLLKDFNKQGSSVATYTMHPISNIRKFIIDNDIKCIADPFAGWGHRMIGANSLGVTYIGCDINRNQYKNLISIKSFLADINTSNINLLNEDSINVDTLNYKYDAIFTCPPYWNTEIYTEEGIENLDYTNYKAKLVAIIRKWITPSVKVVGIQLNEKFEDIISEISKDYEKIILNQGTHHFNKDNKNNYEAIYIIKT